VLNGVFQAIPADVLHRNKRASVFCLLNVIHANSIRVASGTLRS
jgi:hypothetical protein